MGLGRFVWRRQRRLVPQYGLQVGATVRTAPFARGCRGPPYFSGAEPRARGSSSARRPRADLCCRLQPRRSTGLDYRTRDLGPSERKKLQALNARIKEISDEIQDIRASLQQLAEAKQGDPDAAETRESGDDEKSALMEKVRVLADEYQKASDTRKSYFAESRNAGFVWLFLRKGPDASTVGSRVGSKGPTLDLAATTQENDSREGVAGDTPVSVNAWLAPAESDSAATHKLTVEIRIKAGWHIYASAPEGSPWQVTDIKVVRPKGVRAVGAWQRPQGLPNAKEPSTKVFEGTVKFARNFRVADEDDIESLEIEVDYQVCNDQLCLRPATIKKSVAPKSAK